MSVTAGLAIGGAAAGLLGGLFNSASQSATARENLRLQKENLDWQKHVQQQTWQREDTAIQRQKADLIAAGLNPYMAMNGSGANSGSIVSTQAPQQEITPTFGSVFQNAMSNAIGSYFDYKMAQNQIKQQELETKYMAIRNMDAINNFAFDWSDENGILHYYGDKGNVSGINLTNMGKILQQNVIDTLNQGDLLNRQREWYTSDKIESYIMDSIDRVISGSNSARGWFGTPRRGGGYYNYRRNY